MKTKIAFIIALMVTLFTAVVYVGAQSVSINGSDKDTAPFIVEEAVVEAVSVGVNEPKGATGEEIYLIRLSDAPVATYVGGVGTLQATSREATGDSKLDMRSTAAVAYRDHLLREQDALVSTMEQELGRSVEVVYQYYAANNGMAIRMTPEEAQEVSKMSGVIFVQRDYERELHTDNGPAWIGAPGLWDGTNTAGLGTMGEGIIVGVIDTGINPSNPSFADIGGDGYDHTNPWGSGTYVGVCDPNDASYDATFPCNDKLIGAWGYSSVNGGDPTDYDGHGSHTAGTSAGNVVTATVIGPTKTITRTISGVAPHANIIAYSACCTGSALAAAIDQIVTDGVDVVNYSIGSSAGTPDMWNDFDTAGYLSAREAGIFVATSAGNDGPSAATLGSPADAPWLTSVGATTHDRAYPNSLINISGDITVTADINGKGFTSGHGPAPIVYAGDYPNANDPSGDPEQCLEPYPEDTWTNDEIVVCDRGSIARTAKGQNVLAGGAGGYILANDVDNGNSLTGDAHYLPALHISYDDGVTLKAWLANGDTNQVATITGSVLNEDDSNGDIMAGFSSRGENQALADMVGPSITAPGVDIIAANGTGDAVQWGFNSGTSMASPHIAGAAALLMAIHPEWSPAEVQSAMMLTSWMDVLDSDGTTQATPFAMGNGRIDLNVAAKAGFVMDETIANYEAANPADDGDPKTLNLPSMGDSKCLAECSWTRTISSTQDSAVTWNTSAINPLSTTLTIEPASFVLPAYGQQVITITADVSAADNGVWAFGHVVLTATTSSPATHAVLTTVASPPDAHLAVAVKPTNGILPDLVEINTRRDAGSQLIPGLETTTIPTTTLQSFGLALPITHTFTLTQADVAPSFPDIFFQPATEFTEVTVPVGTQRLVAAIVNTTSPDVDMIVFHDANDNGIAELDDIDMDNSNATCQSATGGSSEKCDIMQPVSGRWFVGVFNYTSSANVPDSVELHTAVVTLDSGNMSVTGPASAEKETPFDLRVYWDEPAMMDGETWYGAFSIGTDPANPGNIGTTPVNITRHADDVTKTADRTEAPVDGLVQFTIEIQPNISGEDMVYTITDTIPAGMTYVPDSVTGGAVVTGDTLTWSDTMIGTYKYNMTTSDNDPMCDTGFGGYVNLEAFGILAQPTISGDTGAWTAFSTGSPFSFYGVDHAGMTLTDDGFVVFDAATNNGGLRWVPQTLPDPALPNNLIAMLWQDMEIFYNEANNTGVSIATAGANVAIIEYDNIEFYDGSVDNWDFEVVALRQPVDAPGNYEYVIAYDNLDGDLDGPLTVGIENAAGDEALTLVNKGDASSTLSNDFMVCYDWAGPTSSHTITYWATVDTGVANGTVLTNTVSHEVDNIGSDVVDIDLPVTVVATAYGVDLSDDDAMNGTSGDDVTYTLTVSNTGNIVDTYTIAITDTWGATSPITVSVAAEATSTFDVEVTIPAGIGVSDVATVTVTSETVGMVYDVTHLTTTADIFYTYLPVIFK